MERSQVRARRTLPLTARGSARRLLPRAVLRVVLATLVLLVSAAPIGRRVAAQSDDPHVLVLDMQMMILPGTVEYLQQGLDAAENEGAVAVVIRLDTPGGLLQSAQELVQLMFRSPVPVIVYVGPSGGSAASAGVFVTMAAHVAAMAPVTSIGAAHPVLGTGKDLEGDLRSKAENLAGSMVKSIAETRGRNAVWAEKSVRESSSLTEREAVEQNVVDFTAGDLDELLRRSSGRTVKVADREIRLDDLTRFPIREFPISFRGRGLNLLANPNVITLLWLAATTGISIELYHPGAVLPGVVGAISLVLALAASQIIPVSYGAVALLALGALLIGLELWVPSGVLGIGGVISMVIGAMSLIDTTQAPGLEVSSTMVIALGTVIGMALLGVVYSVIRTQRLKPVTGSENLIGKRGTARETFSDVGKVFVEGEIWKAKVGQGVIQRGDTVEVVAVVEGLQLEVVKVVE